MKLILLGLLLLLAGCSWFASQPMNEMAKHTAPPPPPPAASGIAPSAHSDADVKLVQQKLGVTADGVWGPASARAMRDYQRDNGLPITGLADNATLVKMNLAPPPPPLSPQEQTPPQR